MLDYVIKNHKNVYIRVNKNGAPVTCGKHEKTLFEYSKARNILECLPKTLKKLKFKIEVVPDIICNKTEDVNEQNTLKVIQSKNYKVPDNVIRWVEKFGICDDILKEAQKRKNELNKIMSNYDKSIINWLHEVELEKKKNASGGYIKYSEIKDIVDKRREIKDEWTIINNILRMDFRNLDRDVINKAVLGLANRKFTYRIIEEEETDVV